MNAEELDPQSAEFARRTRLLLERSAQELPARIRSRLTQARYAALERARTICWRLPRWPHGVAGCPPVRPRRPCSPC